VISGDVDESLHNLLGEFEFEFPGFSSFEDDVEVDEENVTRKRGRPPKTPKKINEIEEQILIKEEGVQNSEEYAGDAVNGRPHSRRESTISQHYEQLRHVTLT
jgi:hypothetical protein